MRQSDTSPRGGAAPMSEESRKHPAPAPIRKLAALNRTASLLSATEPVSLPEQPAPLIGRDELLRTTTALLARPDVRLVTLTGFGGVGKTHLATEVARLVADDYDLVRFVDLAPLDSNAVLPAIATAVGLHLRLLDPAFTRLSIHLRSCRTLLLLDNFEHVLDAAAQIAALLATTRDLDLLVTSREPLHLRWEHLVCVPPLAIPDDRETLEVEDLAGIPAVALFVSHIQRLQPQFKLNADNAPLVAALTRRLDGLPLALELAASRLQTHSLRQLSERLEGGLGTLRYDLRDLPARQSSIQAAMDWSFNLLSPAEQQVLRQAAIFAGGASLAAARAVIDAGPDAEPVEDVLTRLAEKSLITFEPLEGAPRFTMFAIAREYLLEKASDERPALERRFAAYYLDLVDQLTAGAATVSDSAALGALHRERGNFRAILAIAASGRNLEAGVQLALKLADYWYRTGQLGEAAQWFERLLSQFSGSEQSAARISLLRNAGQFALYRGDLQASVNFYEAALEAIEAAGASDEHVATLIDLANVWLCRGDVAEMERVLARLDALPGPRTNLREAGEQYMRGALLATAGAFDQAREALKAALDLAEALGDPDEATWITLRLGDVELLEANDDAARAAYTEVVERASRANHWALELRGRLGLGIIAGREANRATALAHLADAFEIAAEQGDRVGMAMAIDALSTLGLSVALIRAEWLPLAGLAAALFEEMGIVPASLARRRTDAHRQLVRDVLGEAEAARLEANGRSLAPEQIHAMLEEARSDELAEPTNNTQASSAVALEPVRLTRREREVVRLIARGLTNRQIAVELDIADRTVDTHVTNIFKKLGVSSRVKVAAWAVERGMTNQ